jgi:predicted transposase YbfD/YdcC
LTAPEFSSWLTDCLRRHLPAGTVFDPVPFRQALEGRLTDTRKARGKRHELVSLVSVAAGGAAGAYYGPLQAAQAAAGWDQEVLAAHGCRISPRTGLREAPSASMLDRLGKFLLDPDEFEAAVSAAVAAAALDPAIPAAYAAHRAEQQREQEERRKKRKRKPPAAESFREERDGSWFRPHPQHPWLDRTVCGDPGHVPARQAVAVDGKERKGAKKDGNKKVHLLAAVTHVPGLVIAQDKVAKAGKANEISHFKPLLAPLPLEDVLVTADAMQANRDNSLFLRARDAHYLWPVLGNQPGLNAQLNALDWENTPVSAATSEITRGRIETRTIRALPAPQDTGFEDAKQALLIERYVTYKKKGQWHTRAESVLYLTSLAEDQTTPEDLLAHVRGHWRVEHTHWLRDVIWKEDKSLIRTGNGPQVWSAITNLVITLFRIRGVTRFAEATRRCAQDPRRALQLLGIPCPSPG